MLLGGPEDSQNLVGHLMERIAKWPRQTTGLWDGPGVGRVTPALCMRGRKGHRASFRSAGRDMCLRWPLGSGRPSCLRSGGALGGLQGNR